MKKEVSVARAVGVLVVAWLGSGCIPDAGSDWSPTTDAATEVSTVDTGRPETTPSETSSGGLCDDSAPSQVVEIAAYAEGFLFYFSPAGADPGTLYVPANAEVHFKLSQSAAEEAHFLQITLKECNTPLIPLSKTKVETDYVWKAPKTPGTYAKAGLCTTHKGMDFDIVVSP